jgi:Cu(I)/Ag(I) efflux system membrane fusion protein
VSASRRSRLVSAALIALAIVAAVALRKPIAGWFSGTRTGGTVGQAVHVDAGELSVSAALVPDVARQQGQSILVDLAGPGGTPVTGAKVSVSYDMPAMGAMPEMKGDATVVEEGGGRHRASFDLPMGGTWTIRIAVESAEGNAAEDFTLTVGHAGLVATRAPSPQPRASSASPVETLSLPATAVDSLRGALDAYERIRASLAVDRFDGVTGDARTLSEAARAAVAGARATPAAGPPLSAIADDADRVANAKSLDDARQSFDALSRDTIALVARVPELQAGWHVFQCPMAEGQPRWIQRKPETASNPYLGTKMATCGNANEWSSIKPAGEDVEVTMDDAHRQLIGVRTERARLAPMKDSIRAIGKLTYDESALSDVSLKVRGWIKHLYVTKTGQHVARGQPLFTLYSPEIYAAEQDYALALRGHPGYDAGASLAAPARQKLHLLGLTDAQLDALAKTQTPIEDVTFFAPAAGFVIEKSVVEGSAIEPGQRLYRIAALGEVWVEAEVYEGDYAHVSVGQKAKVELDYLPGKTWDASIGYVYPYLDDKSRTGRVRVVLKNPDLDLRPGMYATVSLEIDLGSRLQVPVSAVVYTGPRRLVFVDRGGGRFVARVVTLGAEAGGMYEVLSGLQPDDAVVTTGAFLVAADARLDTNAPYWNDDGKGSP